MSESQHSRPFLLLGGLSAIFASLCCLGPLLLVALGFGGAWLANLTALEPYRPIFIMLSLLALFFAWRSIFLAPRNCEPNGLCHRTTADKRYAVIFWIVTALTTLAFIFPYLLPLFY